MDQSSLVNLRDGCLGKLKPKGNDAALLNQICDLSHQLGDCESVFNHIQDPAEAYYILGRFSLALGRCEEALRHFIDAVILDRTSTAARKAVLDLYYRQAASNKPQSRFNFATVINCSSLDAPFINQCVKNIREASEFTVIVAYDRLFSGSNELEALDRIFSMNRASNIDFKIHPLPALPDTEWFVYYNRSRISGFETVRSLANYTLFIDGDEVADAVLFREWLAFFRNKFDQLSIKPVNLRFANYWYFREPIYQSLTTENSPILVQNDFLEFLLRAHPEGIAQQSFDRDFYDFTGLIIRPPIFHHYSWVGTKERFLKKVQNSAHINDIDWINRIQREFEHPFNGTDFVHGYQYQTVPNQFGIQM